MLPKWFKEYLSFHRSERIGVIFLAMILLALVCFNLFQRFYWKPDFEEIQLEYGPKILEFTEKQDSISKESFSHRSWQPEKVVYFKFDPNTLDSAGWVNLGFSPKQSASIIKYRNAGAIFKKPRDVKKLFVVDDEKYEELRPFIQIEVRPDSEPDESVRFEFSEKKKESRHEKEIVELNSADTTDLKKLIGIGSSFAKRIVKYRELLGGYLSKEQLLEVYGMDSARYFPISENVLVDTTVRTRININSGDFKELLKHPYLNKNQVKAIVNYRKQHGNFKELSDLESIHLLKGEPYRKIAPYFTVQ